MSLRLVVFCACCLLLPSAALSAQESQEEVEPELRTYQLVLVRPDPDFEESDSPHDRLADHRMDRVKTAGDLYLDNLVKDEVAVVAGPLPHNHDIQQVAILDRDSIKDAEFVFQQSPAVTTGRLKLEYYNWTARDGVLRRAKDAYQPHETQIGLLFRADHAPTYTSERLAEIEAGHHAHLKRMEEMGELVISGVVDKGNDLYGVLIFRARTADRIEELAAQDPEIKAGRLRLELHTWEVAVGSWPRLNELGIKKSSR